MTVSIGLTVYVAIGIVWLFAAAWTAKGELDKHPDWQGLIVCGAIGAVWPFIALAVVIHMCRTSLRQRAAERRVRSMRS